jgi:hypothetical protein
MHQGRKSLISISAKMLFYFYFFGLPLGKFLRTCLNMSKHSECGTNAFLSFSLLFRGQFTRFFSAHEHDNIMQN